MARLTVSPTWQAKLDRLTPTMRKKVLAALEKLQRRLTPAQWEQILQSGDALALERVTRGLAADLQSTARVLSQAVAVGTAQANASLVGSLTLTNPEAIIAAARTATLVREVTIETKRAISAIIRYAFTNQVPVADTAKIIRPLIGLTERQALAVLARRVALLKAGKPADQVTRMVEKYGARLLKQRAEMIARTEVNRASIDGQLELWRQAQRKGLLPSQAKKTWVVTLDDRLCPVCEAVGGISVPLDQAFQVKRGNVLGPPAHPNCRCALVLDAKSLIVTRRRAA